MKKQESEHKEISSTLLAGGAGFLLTVVSGVFMYMFSHIDKLYDEVMAIEHRLTVIETKNEQAEDKE